MAGNLRALRRKIKTVRSIEHITRAMQFVAAAKLAKLQKRVAAGRDYARSLQEILRHVAASGPEITHAYLEQREIKQIGLVLMGGDRGLCGAFNQQIMRSAEAFLAHAEAPVSVITVGTKATRFAQRHGLDLVASYPGVSELGRSSPALALAQQIRSLYDTGVWDQVHVVYEDFQSVLRHQPQSEQLLPVPAETQEAAQEAPGGQVWGQYSYEPPAKELLEILLPQALDAVIYQMALGTQTAEQAARMTAMRAATDSANEMITNLSRRLNRARQYGITSEIMDVVGGASAIGAL
jgi:F-type H+-transporting ATPase subunit gamma